jgi:hypothetical protein
LLKQVDCLKPWQICFILGLMVGARGTPLYAMEYPCFGSKNKYIYIYIYIHV